MKKRKNSKNEPIKCKKEKLIKKNYQMSDKNSFGSEEIYNSDFNEHNLNLCNNYANNYPMVNQLHQMQYPMMQINAPYMNMAPHQKISHANNINVHQSNGPQNIIHNQTHKVYTQMNPNFIPRPVIDYTDSYTNSDFDNMIVTSEMDKKRNVKYDNRTSHKMNNNISYPYYQERDIKPIQTPKINKQIFFPHEMIESDKQTINNSLMYSDYSEANSDMQICKKTGRVVREKYATNNLNTSTPNSYYKMNYLDNYGNNFINNINNINSLNNINHFKQPSSYSKYNPNDIKKIPLPVSTSKMKVKK